jgi:hypothetical protein
MPLPEATHEGQIWTWIGLGVVALLQLAGILFGGLRAHFKAKEERDDADLKAKKDKEEQETAMRKEEVRSAALDNGLKEVRLAAEKVAVTAAQTEATRMADAKEAKASLARVAEKAADAAQKVEDVKDSLDERNTVTNTKLDGLAKVADATHTLVNSNMGAQLKLNAVVTRRLADLTQDPTDHDAAALADKLLAEHQEKQAIVDSKTVQPDDAAAKQIEAANTQKEAAVIQRETADRQAKAADDKGPQP